MPRHEPLFHHEEVGWHPCQARSLSADCQRQHRTRRPCNRFPGTSSPTRRLLSDDAQRQDVGVAGFILHQVDDLATRTALLDAVVFGNIEQLNAYRELVPDDQDTAEPWDEDDE